MRLSRYGWCCAKDCREEATKRMSVELPEGPELLIPLCDAHLIEVSDAFLSMNEGAWGVVTNKRAEGRP